MKDPAEMRSGKFAAIAWVSIVLAFAASLWIRQAFPTFAIGDGTYDDLLFVRLADYLRQGRWLGPYDNLTLAKGAAYSGFILVNYVLGLPLKLGEHVVYLAASLYFSLVVGSVLRSRASTAVLFVVLAFNPIFWAPEVGGRVVRENLYVSLTLWLVALSVAVYVEPRAVSLAEDYRLKRVPLMGVGVVGALFWLTREEGLWIAPSIFVLAAYWLWLNIRGRRRPLRPLLMFYVVPVACFAVVVGVVDAVNLARYKVFRNNDFRSSDYQSAYGALARIQHDRWAPYVVFPHDARKRAYSVSPAAQELKPYFEGEKGEGWRGVSCEQTRGAVCEEIHSGWFMWALRDAVASAGHYGSGRDSQAFYRRLAREVNAGCESGAIACGPPNHSLIPPWHPNYLSSILASMRRISVTVAALGNPQVYLKPSVGSEEQLGLFRMMTRGRLSSAADVDSAEPRIAIAKVIARTEVAVASIAIPIAILGWFVLLLRARWRRHPGHVVVAALVCAFATRIALLSILDATSIPSDNALYPSPVVALALAIAPCVLFLALRCFAGDTADPGPVPD
ncbi:MAG: hypothetical protein ABIQ84_02420 [Usitatibacter sp.]